MSFKKNAFLLIICFSILFFGFQYQKSFCENIKKEKTFLNDSLQPFTISKSTIQEFKLTKSKYKDKLNKGLKIKKTNGKIEIPLKKPHYPPSIIFKDTLIEIGDTEEREFNHEGYFADINNDLVSGRFWENDEYYLIDKETGNQTTTWNRPYLSQNSKFLANLSMPYGLEGIPNGIQIWKVGKYDLSKYLEIDQQIWVPVDFVWVTDNSLIIKVIEVNKYLTTDGTQNKKDFYYLKLQLK